MVSPKSVQKQLKRIKFNPYGWGRSEAKELPHVLLADEKIFECVNGVYEGGFALLVATNIRLLLVDKKPLNYLTVEDLRFDMINEIDYSHRLMGAHISVSTGSKTLKFTSYNQPRLRKLISHVQHCMADNKKKESDHQEDQKQHLEQINQQLQAYLLAQHQQQQVLHDQLMQVRSGKEVEHKEPIEIIKPDPGLSDYLLAQSLLAQHKESQETAQHSEAIEAPAPAPEALLPAQTESYVEKGAPSSPEMADLYAEGMQEIFGKRQQSQVATPTPEKLPSAPHPVAQQVTTPDPATARRYNPLEINPLKIAYSKLPMALRNKKVWSTFVPRS